MDFVEAMNALDNHSNGVGAANSNQAESDAKLFSTLCEIDRHNYLYLFERCKEFNTNARQLRYLTKEHIRMMIPAQQVGIMAEFEHLLGAWKRKFFSATSYVPIIPAQNGFGKSPIIASVTSIATPQPSTSTATTESLEVQEPPPKRSKSAVATALTALTTPQMPSDGRYPLEEIIPRDLTIVKEEYKYNGTLTEINRRRLTNTITGYFMDNKIRMTKEIMDDLADQIVAYFPTETRLVWHDTQTQKRRGRFYVKYNNLQRKRIPPHFKLAEPDTMADVSQDMHDLEQDDPESEEDAKQLQELLKQYGSQENYDEEYDEESLINLWYKTANYRIKQLQKGNAIDENRMDKIFEDWPAYKLPNRLELLTIDFNTIYPKSQELFQERCLIFQRNIRKFYEVELRERTAPYEMFMNYRGNLNKLNEDTKNATLVMLLHVIVRPMRCIHSRQKNKRFLLNNSQDAFCLMIKNVQQMEEYDGLEPKLFILGDFDNVERCFVASKYWRCEMNFMDAFYVCLKIYLTFKIDFPAAALNFWVFVCAFFCKIRPNDDTNMSRIDPIINFLLSQA